MEQIRDFLRLSAGERKGALLLIIALLLLHIFSGFRKSKDARSEQFASSEWQEFQLFLASRQAEEAVSMEIFDPNSLDSAGWVSIGMPPRQAPYFLAFRERISGFYSLEDVKKYRNLDSALLERWLPYMQFATRPPRESPYGKEKESKDTDFSLTTPKESTAFRPRIINKVEINSADSAELESLPGIGASMAARICAYRERLGGFVRLDQLMEVWGMREENLEKAAEYLELNVAGIDGICFNSVDEEQLSNHPYLGRKLARTLIAYRDQRQGLNDIEAIKGCALMTDSIYAKLSAYLRICD